MARKGMEVTTTVTFQVTFKLPKGMNINQAREHIKAGMLTQLELDLEDETAIKCHLTNKEVQYGKR